MRPKLHHILLLLIGLICINASSQQLSSLYATYNVSPSVTSSLTYVNITYKGGSYLLAYKSSSPFFLINATSSTYSFVINSTDIYSIIQPTIVGANLQSVNTTYLLESMNVYNQSSSAPLSDCIFETGLTRFTCTAANQCESCEFVPSCNKALSATGGFYGPVGVGTVELESQYDGLISNLSIYDSNLTGLNPSNAQSAIANIEKAFSNISSITETMYQNPLFPPPQTADYSQCGNYGASTGNVITPGGPWYCSSVGFCEFLTYNYTLLGQMQDYINHLVSLPITKSQITATSVGIANNANSYVYPELNKVKTEELNGILNTTLLGYSTQIANAKEILNHVPNATLSAQVAAVSSNYSLLTSTYLTANLQSLNATLGKQLSALKSTYAMVNSTYYSVIESANNNTIQLLELQATPESYSTRLTSLSFQQAIMNAQLYSTITNATATKDKLASLNKQIGSGQGLPNVLQGAVRAINAPVATAILGSGSYSEGVINAPLLATIPSIIIALILLSLLFLIHRSLHAGHRIRRTPRTTRNWRVFFTLAFIVAILYIILTYNVAVTANASAPLAVAAAAIKSSGSVVVAINGSSNPSLVYCENLIVAGFKSDNKTVNTITMNGLACDTGTVGIETTDTCLSYYASKGMPVVVLSNSTRNSVTAYSFYGTVLRQSGTPQFTDQCLAYIFTR